MSLWTRILDALAEFGGSVAQLLARIGGDGRPPEESVAFTIGMIALGAKMAKADGIVSDSEITAFRQIFHVPDSELSHVARVFNLAKQDVAGFESYARQVARLFHDRPAMLEDVLDGLFHIAKADELLHADEMTYLGRVAEIFGFSRRDFARITSRHVAPDARDPYVVLGLAPGASDDEVRKRYLALVRENHPDRHIAAGMPPELVAIATERLAAINAAYEALMREHQS